MSFASKFFSKTLGGVREVFSGSLPVYHDKRGHEYHVKKLLSDAGRFGQIYIAEDGANHFAVKVMPINADNRAAVHREARFMEMLAGHPNIVRLEAFITNTSSSGNEAVFVMELCDGGSLLDVLNAHAGRQFPEPQLLAIFLDICKAVAHMHSQKPPIAHRDIKIENVLRRGTTWKLCDFGSATTTAFVARDDHTRQVMSDDIERNTTATYRAPEMCDLFRKQLVCEKVDVWALGCTLYKMAFFVDAFEDGTLQILNNRWSIPKTSAYSPHLHDLIRFMLEPDPMKRPHIGQNFVPFTHACAAEAEACSVATSGGPKPQPARANLAKNSADFFSMLEWEDDSKAPAPAPAPSHAKQEDFFAHHAAQQKQEDFFAHHAAQQKQAQAPTRPRKASGGSAMPPPQPQEDLFAKLSAAQTTAAPTRPRKASGGGSSSSSSAVTPRLQEEDLFAHFPGPATPALSPPPGRPTALKVDPPQAAASTSPFFDNDFSPFCEAPPTAAVTTATTTASTGAFWTNDFNVPASVATQRTPRPAGTSPAATAATASSSSSSLPRVTPPTTPSADDLFAAPVSQNDALFSVLQPALSPTVTPTVTPPLSPTSARARTPPRSPTTSAKKAAVTVDTSRTSSFESDVLAAWK